jgi:hypothetical protein
MNKKTEIVFRGFLELSVTERSELVDAINDYFKKDYLERRSVEEAYKSVVLGPLSSNVCPCCGR